MKVLIADDEPLARERLSLLVQAAQPGAEITEAMNGADALALLSTFTPDVLFLDVQMPSLDGFEVLAALPPAKWPTTVFVTAFDEYALRAFEVSAVDYLLKPFDDERFMATWQRIQERRTMRAVAAESEKFAELLLQLRAGGASAVAAVGVAAPNAPRRFTDRVLIKRDGRSFMVRLADVQWVESSGNYVVLHSGKEKHQLRETLTNLESRLDPDRFVRIHRRMIVAVDAMRELQPWFGGDQVMILKDGVRLRVSRNFREHVSSRLSGLS